MSFKYHQWLHSAQIGGQTNQIPFTACTIQSAKTELPKTQHPFHPAIDRFRDPCPLPITGPAIGSRQLFGHSAGGWIILRIKRLEDCIDCNICIPLYPVAYIHDTRSEGIVEGSGGYTKIRVLQTWAAQTR